MIGNKNEKGVLQYTMSDFFSYIEEVKDEREVNLWGSYMEIYNE